MDTRNGNILTPEQAAITDADFAKIGKPSPVVRMNIQPTKKQMGRKGGPKIGRNEPCGCGSGKKFKKCCLVSSVMGKYRHKGGGPPRIPEP